MGDFVKDILVKCLKDKVEDHLPSFLQSDDKDKDKDGGMFSIFKGKDDKDDDKDDEDKDNGGNFFSNIFKKDDDDDVPEKTGFIGLYTEQGGAGPAKANEGGSEELKGCDIDANSDLFQDLMDVAEETPGK